MKLITKKTNQITFSAGAEENLANAIRRYVNEIPVLAIDEIEIFKNDSAMYDETLAHRIGLIPLKMEKSFNDKTEISMKLSVNKGGVVLSKELKGEAEVIYPEIPITILNEGQELELLATAKLGKGKEHSKFSPGMLFYRNLFEVQVDKNFEEVEEALKACPKGVFKIEGKKLLIDSEKCDMCEACTEETRKLGKNAIKITPAKELVFTIESFGQMDVKDIFKEAIKELKKDLGVVSKHIEKA